MVNGMSEEVFKNGQVFCQEMAKYVKVERSRIGGDWAVAQAVPTRRLREEIKKILPEVHFVTLSITEDHLKKRLEGRHGEEQSDLNEHMLSIHKCYEPAEENEINAFDIELNPTMTPDDVVDIVLHRING